MSLKNLMSDLLSLFVLKANFNSLFDSRLNSKKEFIATQATIGSSVSTVQITTSGQKVVSPCSGYAYLRFGGLNSASKAFLNVTTEHVTHQHDLSYVGYVNSMQVPVQKGESITVNYNGFSNPESHWINFRKFVGGGGIKSILQTIGGGLWLLSHSFNRFTSSLVAKQCRVVRTLILQSPRLLNGANNLLLHLTDTLKPTFSTQELLNFQTLQQLFEQNPKLKFPERFIFLFIKAINLQHILTTRIRQELISRSSRQSAQANLCLQGGAL